MVITVGCYYDDGEFVWYDSKKGEENSFNIEVNDVVSHVQLFRELQNTIKDPIDYLCLYIRYRCTNDNRKKLYEYAKTQKYVKTIRIIGYYQALLCDAINAFKVPPYFENFLLMLLNRDEYLRCFLWKYELKNGWKLVQRFRQPKTLSGEYEAPTVLDIEVLKLNINAYTENPYIWVHSKCILNKESFKDAFPNSKGILISCDWFASLVALNYAKYLSNENGYAIYKMEPFMDKFITLKQNNSTILSIPIFEKIPYTKTLELAVEKGENIKIYENDLCTKEISAEGAITFNLVFKMDINGIFNLYAKNISVNNLIEKPIEIIDNHYFIPPQSSTYDSDLNAVGIDFGTSECCTAVMRKNGANFVVLDNVTASRTMPSYVAFDEKNPKCGQIVIDRMRNKSEYSVFDIKRIIGKSYENISVDALWPFKIVKKHSEVLIETSTFNGRDQTSAEEVATILFEHIKTTTEIYQDVHLTDAVITIPSKFTDEQKNSLRASAELAGWKNVYFLPEPVAASFVYFLETEILNYSNIFIFDCGGGTVDICVARKTKNQLEILNFDGDAYLGGRDFDNILFTHFNGILKHMYQIDVTKNRKKYVLYKKCQEIKRTLSIADEDWLNVDDFDNNNDEVIKITKTEFEEMSLPLILRMQDVILRALDESDIAINEIDYVFQVGGGCRMPMIKKLLADTFPDSNQQCSLYPDWVVAHGAALYAYHLQKTKTGTTMTYTSQAPPWLRKHFKTEISFSNWRFDRKHIARKNIGRL